ncbi:MAG: DUF4838 domain-containing protein [Clostridia bacterium]|nr:DUF4838 domain-containing protein [Clostridia bacterium]
MKKILTVTVALFLLLAMTCSASAALVELYVYERHMLYDETFVLGDANGDESVDGKDALSIKSTVAGASMAEINGQAADFDADGAVSAKDSYALKLVNSGAKAIADYETVNGKKVNLYKFTIAGNDISKYSIVLSEDATDEDNSSLAAVYLRDYIEKATNITLPIVFGESNMTTEKMIRIVQYDFFSEKGQEYGADGLEYEVKDGNLYLYGALRGTMYSAFEILETYVGMRFYSNDKTFVYKNRAVDIPEGTTYEYCPKLRFRHASHTYGSGGALKHYFPNRLCGTQLYSYTQKLYGTLTGPLFSNAHSFNEYWKMGTGKIPEDTTGMTDEEIRAARWESGNYPDPYNWQPCATNNTDYEILFEGMLDCTLMAQDWHNEAHFEEGVTCISFSICDNGSYCQCRGCRKVAITQGEGYCGLNLMLYNRAVEDIQEYYPGVKLMGIMYAKDFPKTIKPHKDFIIIYCGVCCHNHIIGQEACYPEGGQCDGMKNDKDLVALKYWGEITKETGTEIWFWIYPVNYHYFLCDTPNVPNLYWNTRYLIDECGVDGFYYEGGGEAYSFEPVKAYAMSKLLWDSDMTYDEFNDVIKDFLYVYFGGGAEEIFEYMGMLTEAGDLSGTCFVNNFDRPGDMYSYEYLAENYEYMRGLLVSALEKAKSKDQQDHVLKALVCCDFMGLSSVHTDWYVNGENKELYCERYTWMYNTLIEQGMTTIFSTPDYYLVPSTIDFEINPMIQFYELGSRRDGVYP